MSEQNPPVRVISLLMLLALTMWLAPFIPDDTHSWILHYVESAWELSNLGQEVNSEKITRDRSWMGRKGLEHTGGWYSGNINHRQPSIGGQSVHPEQSILLIASSTPAASPPPI